MQQCAVHGAQSANKTSMTVGCEETDNVVLARVLFSRSRHLHQRHPQRFSSIHDITNWRPHGPNLRHVFSVNASQVSFSTDTLKMRTRTVTTPPSSSERLCVQTRGPMAFTKDEWEYEEEPIDTNAQGQPSTFGSSELHCCVLYRARFFQNNMSDRRLANLSCRNFAV